MKNLLPIAVATSVLALAGCSALPPAPENAKKASEASHAGHDASIDAVVRGAIKDAANKDIGEVTFRQIKGGVEVKVTASGLTPGFHGLHVHTIGTCEAHSADPSNPANVGDFNSAGGHEHAAAETANHPNHQGDLPSLLINKDGTGSLVVVSDRLILNQLTDKDGAALMIHANADNFANVPTRYAANGVDATTLKTGDAGPRVACGSLMAESGTSN